MSEKNTLKNYCNECDKDTNHIVLEQHTWHSDPEDYDHSQYHKLVKCLGCDNVSLAQLVSAIFSMAKSKK